MNNGNKALNWFVIVAAITTFVKTADVFSYFAPEWIGALVGFDVSFLYGIVQASLVEGTMLTLHFQRAAHRHAPAIAVKWTLLAIVFLCQVFDGFLVTDTLMQQSDELKFIFQYLVPGLPIIIILMIFAIGAIPDDGTQVAHTGLKNRLPNWRKIWEGDESGNASNPTGNESNPTGNRLGKAPNWQSVRDNLQKTDLQFIAGGKVEDVMSKYGIGRKTAYNWKGYAKSELEAREK